MRRLLLVSVLLFLTGCSKSEVTFRGPEDIVAASSSYNLPNDTAAVLYLPFDDSSREPLVENVAAYEPQFAELRNGAHFTPLSGQGKIGRAIELDGIDDVLVLDNPSMLHLTIIRMNCKLALIWAERSGSDE
jgi:hypothetical protein